MEFIGEKTELARSAKVFGTLGGIATAAGIAYLIITKFSNLVIDVVIATLTGIAIGATYGCVRFLLRGSTPRVVIENGVIYKEDLKKEKVIHLNRGKMVISELMGYPVDEIYRYLNKQVKKHRSK